MALILIGIVFSLIRRSAYISPHELSHAQLNSTDEYIESGLGTVFRITGLGLIASGGLVVAAGIAVNSGILPCSEIPVGVIGGFGFLATAARLVSEGTKRAQEAIENKAKSLHDKLPSSMKPKKVSDTFKETEDSHLHDIDDNK